MTGKPEKAIVVTGPIAIADTNTRMVIGWIKGKNKVYLDDETDMKGRLRDGRAVMRLSTGRWAYIIR